ncbi:MAG: hypothetical protein J7L55_05660 [Desulfurococcales archaeon]|nr:hypothetical protein [Desulfurococcales archaeon]
MLELLHEVTGKEVIKETLEKRSVELALLEDVYITWKYVGRDFSAEKVKRLKEVVEEVENTTREAAD